MARATFVKSAQKDILNADGTVKIAKGQSYWWWKFRHGGKHTSLTQPKPSQLTQSSFLSAVYGIQERIAELSADDGLADARDEIVGELEELRDQAEESRENMPESLQESATGELLQARYDAMQEAIDELEGIELEPFEPADKQECPECSGGKITNEHDTEVDCPTCEGTGEVDKDKTGEDGQPLVDEPLNDDGETEAEYWANKLEEIQGVDIGTGD